MAKQSTAADRLIDRRTVLQTGAALAAAGPALLRVGPLKRSRDREARPR
jgi:hypothetical protein